ncbi:hypothetical protein O9992_14105 [Vibrio lentus]|nr:hypothetical protein [Vibrio lentus]
MSQAGGWSRTCGDTPIPSTREARSLNLDEKLLLALKLWRRSSTTKKMVPIVWCLQQRLPNDHLTCCSCCGTAKC